MEKQAEPTPRKAPKSSRDLNLGDYLKKQRQAKSIPLKVVSKNSKISMTNLEALEENDFSRLPDKIYIAGYIKSYARLLGIDPGEGLRLLDISFRTRKTRGASAVVPPPALEGIVRSSQSKRALHTLQPRAIGFVVVCLILATAGFLLLKPVFHSLSAPRKLAGEASSELNVGELNAQTPMQKPIAQAPVEPALVSSENPQEEEKPEEKPKEELEEEKRKFIPMGYPLYGLDQTMSREEIDKLLPQEVRGKVVSGKQNVYIRATGGNSWLAYKSDKRSIRQTTLQEGQGIFISARELRVFLGNANTAKIFLNNQPLKIPSRNGVKSLVFPQKNYKKYVTPLFIYHKSGKFETSQDYIRRTKNQ